MLGKLMKYEFRATAIYFLPIYAALVLISGMRYIVGIIAQNFSNGITNLMTFGLSSVYLLLAVCLAVTAFVVIIIRFYKNLLGNEGYLMFTLPVTVEQNILAKLIPAAVWFMGSAVLGVLTIIPAMGGSWSDFFGGLVSLENAPMLLLMLLIFAGCVCTSFLFFYLCMCIGQLCNSHRFLATAGVYIGLQTAMQIISLVGAWCLAANSNAVMKWVIHMAAKLDSVSAQALIYTALGVAAIVVFAIGTVLFFIDSAILKKKLNLI